jgi:hypothetical protein
MKQKTGPNKKHKENKTKQQPRTHKTATKTPKNIAK